MNLASSLKLVLALFVLACNPIQAFAADKAKEVKLQPFSVDGKSTEKPQVSKTAAKPTPPPVVKKREKKVETRYVATGDYVPLEKVGYKQPKFKSPATVNGLGLKTAKQLGIDGKKVYNEQEKSARVVILSPDALVFYDTGSLEPLYLAGCIRDGKPFANRLKLVETPVKKAVAVAPTITVSVPEPTPVPVYIKPETVVVATVKEEDIVVPVYSPRFEVTLHKQNIIYAPEQIAHPVQVWERPNVVANRNVKEGLGDNLCYRTPAAGVSPPPPITW